MCFCDEKRRLPGVFNVNDQGHYDVRHAITRDNIIRAGITLLGDDFLRTVRLNKPVSSRDFMKTMLSATTEDTLAAAYLDCRYRVVAYERWRAVELDNYLAPIIKTGLNCSAFSIVVGHQHGPKTPEVLEMITSEDCRLVSLLDSHCGELSLELLDYIVCTPCSASSFFELTESSPFKNRYPVYEKAPELEFE